MNKIPIIISMTSTHYRIDTLYECLDSIINGTYLPERILLYLSKEPHLLDNGVSQIPTNLEKYKDILEIKWVKNIGAHRKFFYSFTEYPKHLILTIDDDNIYPPNYLEVMYSEYNSHKDCIIAGHGKIIKGLKYTEWLGPKTGIHKNNYFFCGNPGTLFNTELLPAEIFDLEKILKYSPTSSEMWLNFYLKYLKIPVYFINKRLFTYSFPFPMVEGSQTVSLQKYHRTNNWEKKEKIFNNIIKYFNITDDVLSN